MPLFGPPNIAQLEAKRDAQGLIKALSYKDAAIRIAAAQALAPLKDPLAVEPLVFLLDDHDSGVRLACVGALAERGGFRVVEPLVGAMLDLDPVVRATAANAVYRRLMTDPDQDTRRATAAAVGRIHAADGVQPLIKATMDADEGVRAAAIKALHVIDDVEAVLPLILVLANEQARVKATGRSSLIVERAASQALDALCDNRAVDSLQTALAHSDAAVREIAIRRLARLGIPEVADTLVAALGDNDSAIRRSAARGLQEMGWQPAKDEAGARYWAALREWSRCADCGEVAIPLLVDAFDRVDSLERADIVAALAKLEWSPAESDAMAGHYWAGLKRWDKCIEIGTPAVGALDAVLRSSPQWRDRISAAAALAALGQERTAPCARLDLVQKALGMLDGEGDADAKRGALEAFLAEEHQFDREAGESVEWCDCGYPAARVHTDGLSELMTELLASEKSSSNSTAYFCPSCNLYRASLAA